MQDDAQNELKRRARRRIVGATALALAAVIVLPMVMDHEPRMPAQDIQVRIPSQEGSGGIASRILPGKGATPLPPAAPVVEAKAAMPTPVVEPVAPAKPEAPPEAKPETKPAAKPEPKAAAAPAKPADAKGADKRAHDADAARAAAALSGRNGASGEQWVVQLGAYREEGNVRLLVKKLREMGVPSYTEAFDSPQGPRTRVRAGPFATKDAAEKAQAKAKIIGVNGPVAAK
ncbi:MAG: SPOR domain-containing protein [Gammaproteobacteria bacterium]|nr:SPOR domain-containing protein [Gammaproteobacteria bacterium]MBU1646382.1 SPOR domain-containing protein [Gammaproteobacteria bacterium]MBU1970925.1 SPOR domain-containing protein [Gammaproteobacteria bacterium]